MRGTAVGTAYSLTSAVLPFVALPILKAYGPVAIFSGAAIILIILYIDVSVLGPTSTGQSLELVAH